MKKVINISTEALRLCAIVISLFVASLAANAYDFEADGIYYNILSSSERTCEVTSYDATEITATSALLKGTVVAGDEEVLEQGFEYWAEGGDVQTVTSPDLIMEITITGLASGTTYTYRAYAKTASGTTYSEEMTFTTIKAPTVLTYEATDITSNSATLKGAIRKGDEEIQEKGFEYWTADGDVQTIISSKDYMSETLTGLQMNTTYLYRAYAKTASGTTYGETLTFTTTPTPPTVQTYEATDVTSKSAILHGYVEAGEEDIQGKGFEYWGTDGIEYQEVVTGDDMSATITGLIPDTKYQFRAYATTASKTTYSETLTFTTLGPVAPTVQTYEATDITTNSATLHGYVEAGDGEIQEKGFEYWGTDGIEYQAVVTGDDMSATITGLTPNKKYQFRAYAITASYTTYGSYVSFTTAPTPPSVQTYEATDITENSALLAGYVEAGSESLSGCGFEYWGPDGSVKTVTASGNNISATIEGLWSGSEYSYRAYATTTKLGATYGETLTFTTLGPASPTVLTYEATDITGNSATLKGAIRTGDEEILEHGFEYWTGNSDVQTIISSKDYMSETITGLTLSTTYTYRAYATTESGTTYGEELSFTTLDYADGVSNVNADLEEDARYTTDGKKVSQPQRGINLIRYSDGTVKKVLVK